MACAVNPCLYAFIRDKAFPAAVLGPVLRYARGWIYEKYLTPKEGPDRKKSAQAASKEPDDSNVAALPPPGPYARSYRLRKYGWKRYRYPPVGFAIGVYPRW